MVSIALLKQAHDQVIARQTVVRGNRGKNAGEGADAQRIVDRDGEICRANEM